MVRNILYFSCIIILIVSNAEYILQIFIRVHESSLYACIASRERVNILMHADCLKKLIKETTNSCLTDKMKAFSITTKLIVF